MPDTLLLPLGLAALSGALGIGYYRSRTALAALRARFAPIVSADLEARRSKRVLREPRMNFGAKLKMPKPMPSKRRERFTKQRRRQRRLFDAMPKAPRSAA